MALAASFDRRWPGWTARVVGNEARLKGNDVVYAPTVNILRTPLWGRAFETFGEDPFLTARLGVAWIRGAQAQGVIANVKHFAANNQEGAPRASRRQRGGQPLHRGREGRRAHAARDLPARSSRRRSRRAGSGSVMCSYNALNGAHACENRPLLDGHPAPRLGLQGLRARRLRRPPRHVGTGLRAGLDFEPWPFVDADGGENFTPANVSAALAAGRTTRRPVDRARAAHPAHAVRLRLLRPRRLRGRRRADRQGRPPGRGPADRGGRHHAAEEPTASCRSTPKRLESLAVIGADGDALQDRRRLLRRRALLVRQRRARAITARAGPGVEVRYDAGTDLGQAAERPRAAPTPRVVVVVRRRQRGRRTSRAWRLDCGRHGRSSTATR